jgi:phospholipase C
MRLREAAFALLALQPVACSSSSSGEAARDAGAPDARSVDAGADAALPCGGGACIPHLVVIVQENQTFDNHFGAYCTAAAGSNPTCNTGPACCEAMPATDPAGTMPTVITDAVHAAFDPNHTQACELSEIDNGKMDMFATAAAGCGSPSNVAVADPTIIKPLWDLAPQGALADRYFQPIAGESASNNMYLARAAFEFTDNQDGPADSVGTTCDLEGPATQFTHTTIGDLLTGAGVPWAWFADGYAAMIAAKGACPTRPADCPDPVNDYPCAFDPSDVPFEYYKSTVDNPATMKDLSVFEAALSSGTGLPAVSFVKPYGYKSEHPGAEITLSAGVNWAATLIQQIEASPYASTTLVLLAYDEGGGYFDHVAPPPASSVDGKPYGTRIPLMALGPFARKNFVSHVTMEHSSIVKFIEWNWLGHKTGQLGTRDTVVNNLGSLLDPATTGVAVPED